MSKASRDPFVSLHVHTDHSMLDGASRIPELVQEVKALGQPAVAVTDHGSLGGAYSLWVEANRVGIKPIIGIEVYFAPSHRTEKKAVFWGAPDQRKQDVSGQGAYTHLTLLAKNPTGLRNLYRMHHLANTEGFYRKPRVDRELLTQYSDGVICLSGCMGSELSTRLRLGQVDEAEETAAFFAETFGEDFFVEVMDHGFPEEQHVLQELLSFAHRLNLPMVATNDSHYTVAEDARVQKALLHLQTYGAFTGFDGSGYHLRSHGEMCALNLPMEAIDNTKVIADLVEPYDEVFAKKVRFPEPIPREDIPLYISNEDILYQEVSTGLVSRGIAADANFPHWDRAHSELETICSLGYPTYFLVLADIVGWAKRAGIRVGPGRGSAGGSLVAYALGITDLDPLDMGLIFERFINPQRASIPDIDVDIEDSRRDEVRRYVLDRWGPEYVVMIGTNGTIGAKRALEDSARVLGKSRSTADKMKGMLPPARFGRAPGLDDANWDLTTEDERDILILARGLEGLIRNCGQHAAGIVISPEPLQSILPLRRAAGGKENSETSAWEGLVTEFPMGAVDALGLIKYDFLGLRNLDIISKTMAFIGREIPLPVRSEDCDDTATFRLLQSGETTGVFQLDGSGMRQLLRQIQPATLTDIAAVLALYRPGPMGAGSHTEYARRKARQVRGSTIHSELDLDDILGETYGLIVFQEQVLAVLAKVCAWTYADADLLFNAMRKKDHAKLDAAKPGFFESAEANGTSAEAAQALWDVLVPFADYSFNKAHSAGYALVAYWTAYLKANHPTEYLAALLGSVSDDPDKLSEYLAECQRLGIPILPPDINSSDSGFTPTGDGLRYGLSAIKGVGVAATEAITKRRPYPSLDHFFNKADKKVLNVGVLRALVKAGAMDSLYPKRYDLLLDVERLTELATRARESRGDALFKYRFLPMPTGDVPGIVDQLKGYELETLGVAFTKPKRKLSVDSPLTPSQWAYLRQTLSGGNEIEYTLLYRGQLVHQGVCSISDQAASTLQDLGVKL